MVYLRSTRLTYRRGLLLISEEKKHLSSVLVSNGYPSSFEQKVTKTRNCSLSREHVTQFKSTAVLPYVKGVSEPLRRCLKQQGVHADFRTLSIRIDETAWFTGFPVNAAKSTSVKREDLCKRDE
ncbi:hypothetical protein pdam_00013834, partial [Pocillopora damicornis]